MGIFSAASPSQFAVKKLRILGIYPTAFATLEMK
jgi:hypothetical protein